MKSISFVLILLLSSTSFAPQTATAFSLFPFPLPLPFPVPSFLSGIFGNGSGGSSGGSGNTNEMARICLMDQGDGEACMAEIFGSFFNSQIKIGPECCKAIIEINDDCLEAVFQPFNDSFFTSSVKQFCNYINN